LLEDGGRQKADEYSSMNPSMLLPTLVNDNEDIVLNQSLSIIEYLDENYVDTPSLLPLHTLDKARVRALAQDIACDIQPIINLRVLESLKSDLDASPEQTKDWCVKWIEKGFKAFERRIATRAGKYCYGYEVTLADVCLIPQVYNAIRFNVDMQQFPLIQKIYDNCNKLEAFKRAMPEAQADAP
jgi:maleylacetoacetate isomerase